MSTKAKKAARIRGKLVTCLKPIKNTEGLTVAWGEVPDFLQIPINNPDALVKQTANDLASYGRRGQYLQTWEEISSAALRSIGVPLKGK